MTKSGILFLCAFFAQGYFVHAQTVSSLPNGLWRAMVSRTDGHEIIFNFEVKDSGKIKVLYLKNAGERLTADDIKVVNDSFTIRLPFFDSQIRAVMTGPNQMQGFWTRRLASTDQAMPFSARLNEDYRFPVSPGPLAYNISGRWSVMFHNRRKNDSTLAVGEFVQTGNELTGTFITSTGDYRYLQGVVDNDSLKLSCFDGGHAYLFTASINSESRITGGRYYAGPTAWQDWTAKKDDDARLPDEFSLTKMKKGQSTLNFSFKDIDGNPVSIYDQRFKNKVVIVQLMGSWCPNCMDETRFLVGFYDAYRKKGVEIIALAFERSTDFERSQRSLKSFQQRLHVEYPIAITGVAVDDPQQTEKSIPQLERIQGFPTTIFIDRTGTVAKILTGFNGPATAAHYEDEKKIFYQIVDNLLSK